MAIDIANHDQYELVPYELIDTLEEKLTALLIGDTLLVKKLEKSSDTDVLVRLFKKKFEVTQLSYDLTETEGNPRYWVTFNLGINDLSLYTCMRFNEGLSVHTNQFAINDIVSYISESGISDSGIVEEVYKHKTEPETYAYRLSRDEGLYAEYELVKHKYM